MNWQVDTSMYIVLRQTGVQIHVLSPLVIAGRIAQRRKTSLGQALDGGITGLPVHPYGACPQVPVPGASPSKSRHRSGITGW